MLRQQLMPTLAESDRVLDAVIAMGVRKEKIRAPLFAVNTADDFIDPPELGILEREIKRVPKGRAFLIPAGPDTGGHGTHTFPAVWKHHLAELLNVSAHIR